MIRAGYPLPEKAQSRDEATDRGFDTDSLTHDRVPMETDPALLAALRDQAHGIREMRDEGRHWGSCGDHSDRCDRCSERLCAIDGPEPRACGVTCADCPCDCTACQLVREDARADLLHRIAGEGR